MTLIDTKFFQTNTTQEKKISNEIKRKMKYKNKNCVKCLIAYNETIMYILKISMKFSL